MHDSYFLRLKTDYIKKKKSVQNLRYYRCTGYILHHAFGIPAAHCNLSVLLQQEVKQQPVGLDRLLTM
jgi:hypothetical protein